MRSDSALCLGVHEGSHYVGHFGNSTGRGVLRLSSSISVDVWTPAEIS
ncbi:hypothetical protein [Lysinibacillus xylanilyticus]